MSKVSKTFWADTEEELTNLISKNGHTTPVQIVPDNLEATLQDIQIKLSSLNSKYSDTIANYQQNKADIDQLLTEAHDLANHQNELTADKMNKVIDVQTKIYEFVRVDAPANADKTKHILPNAFNVINLWTEDLTVDLVPVNNDSHLYFVFINGKMYALPISSYDNTSDPIRLDKYVIEAGKGDTTLTFSVMGENANLEILVHANPDDMSSMKLIKFF